MCGTAHLEQVEHPRAVERPSASTSSSTTATTRDEHPRQQSGSEVPVPVRSEGAPPTEGDKCKG